jgi:tetratricopeptide (TPR) repeat protein
MVPTPLLDRSMPTPRAFSIELNPIYLAEARAEHDNLESDIRAVIPWVISRVALARDPDALTVAFGELEPREGLFRAIVGCEVLGQAGSRPDVREWLCQYLGDRSLSEGARYQLAGSYSRLGADARRGGHVSDAVFFARQGIGAIADLPPRAVTANLYYNLGTALEAGGDFDAAIQAFEDSADVDDMIGRAQEAAQSRERIGILHRLIWR